MVMRYFFCCRKRNLRYKQYLDDVSLISKRLDIISLLAAQEHINTLSFVLMKPYQQKIIQFFKKIQDDAMTPYSMPVEEALEQMKKRPTDEAYGEIELKVNQKLERIVTQEEPNAFADKLSPLPQSPLRLEENTLPFPTAKRGNRKHTIS